MLPFSRYCLPVSGGKRMHVMEGGSKTGLPVVMVHGNPTWGFLYRKVAAELGTSQLRLIMPDLVGLGLSDKPSGPEAHTLSNHIRWMSSLLERLELRRCVMVVQDWGGAIGVGALAEQPHIEAGLVVLNTVLTPPKKDFRATTFHRFARTPVVSDVAFRLLGFPQNAMAWAQGDKGSIGGKVAAAYRYPLRHFSNNAAPLALPRMVPDDWSHPSIPALERSQS